MSGRVSSNQGQRGRPARASYQTSRRGVQYATVNRVEAQLAILMGGGPAAATPLDITQPSKKTVVDIKVWERTGGEPVEKYQPPSTAQAPPASYQSSDRLLAALEANHEAQSAMLSSRTHLPDVFVPQAFHTPVVAQPRQYAQPSSPPVAGSPPLYSQPPLPHTGSHSPGPYSPHSPPPMYGEPHSPPNGYAPQPTLSPPSYAPFAQPTVINAIAQPVVQITPQSAPTTCSTLQPQRVNLDSSEPESKPAKSSDPTKRQSSSRRHSSSTSEKHHSSSKEKERSKKKTVVGTELKSSNKGMKSSKGSENTSGSSSKGSSRTDSPRKHREQRKSPPPEEEPENQGPSPLAEQAHEVLITILTTLQQYRESLDTSVALPASYTSTKLVNEVKALGEFTRSILGDVDEKLREEILGKMRLLIAVLKEFIALISAQSLPSKPEVNILSASIAGKTKSFLESFHHALDYV